MINRFTIHTFAHKPDNDRPGMVMGHYGVHWDRGQTWWPMVDAYHRYITRCSEVLRQGRTRWPTCSISCRKARPTCSNLLDTAYDKAGSRLPDRRGYNFDGCSSGALIKLATVRDGSVVFPAAQATGCWFCRTHRP